MTVLYIDEFIIGQDYFFKRDGQFKAVIESSAIKTLKRVSNVYSVRLIDEIIDMYINTIEARKIVNSLKAYEEQNEDIAVSKLLEFMSTHCKKNGFFVFLSQ